ncbi:ParB N-terminal domain-containing protein [Flagellimonas marina]|uniref:ParB N-terminal domain-containing protein n=1 Tax=Flagellimonas marina TaxID=1775168 RepID=A0ABV8PKC7_9FLAO
MQIQQTTDYERFQIITGNRSISQKKVDRIINDVNNGLNLFPYCPVIVCQDKGKMKIIDGQHRFKASKKLEMPIHYVVAEDISIRDIARMNSNTDKWKYIDFLNCYIKLGIDDYKVLKGFMKEQKVQLRLALGLLMAGVPRSSSDDAAKFMDGEFKVRHLEWAKDFIMLADRLFGPYEFYRDINLLRAVHKLEKIGKWDIDMMEQKIRSHPTMMDKQTTDKNYMLLLQQIYNMRNREIRSII